ncbi:RNA polymerase sigma factor [Mucilaginibacter myungsuensis]|uniref:Sigma-70 family RNA polymerase sigma factor n=1 Tax=Mucilaginibacter myungsuensis TaxID=649104 RepID=A0A929KRS8_9SPHI|nr:sigma-70 family RNA polymerase sigma factor [Mucilaginibacter myungsuensis]MBE9660324.1 sigma-70 family RNA polymerase sigma factor [Mucilaginibacter myungsuensis]MDN3600366.1 sigma-70 family RNA polymerase sigma factor [Mucilaginibacter myungsuensis]
MSEKDFLSMIQDNQGIIHKICRIYRDSPEDREDLFQEVVFQLWRSYPSFSGGSKSSTWLYRVALNTAVASFRKNRPNITTTEYLPDVQFEDINNEDNERQEEFLAGIRQLSEPDRALIALYLEELSYQQIAGILGISENNVGVKLNRIKVKLQKIVK